MDYKRENRQIVIDRHEVLKILQCGAHMYPHTLEARFPQFRLPEGATWLSRGAQAWDPNQARGLAIHGGHWLAQPVSPPGVAPSGLYGHSSNQQVMVASARVDLKPDDYVFFRPQQSEALLLQFGDEMRAGFESGVGRPFDFDRVGNAPHPVEFGTGAHVDQPGPRGRLHDRVRLARQQCALIG